MGTFQSKMFRQHRNLRGAAPPGSTAGETSRGAAAMMNTNKNENHHNGNGNILNVNPAFTIIDQRPPPAPVPYASEMSNSVALPPKPIIFHGRDALINDTVTLMTGPSTARVAFLGSGGMGKTTVAVALLYELRVIRHFGANNRLFLSCENFADGDAMVIGLAKVLGLPASSDLLAAVIARLTELPRVVLVLDNLETVWLVGGGPEHAVEQLLGRLAQIPSLSLIITCRGNMLPQHVEWSNSNTAELKPFLLEAALETFQDKAGRRLNGEDKSIAKRLLNAIDRMPLAVSLLGQLARLGNSVAELFIRWNHEYRALLQTHGAGRFNSVEVSIELSIAMLCAADRSGESLQFLSLCCLLPDGLHPGVFEGMRRCFNHIYRARDTLSAYALASVGPDGVLKTLNPIRHVVLRCHPPQQKHQDRLHAIYLDIADRLPTKMDEHFRGLAASAAPEMGNLTSLLLRLVYQPSQRIVDAVVRFTESADLQLPTVTVACALLPYLEHHPRWKADCLKAIGVSQISLGDYRWAVEATTTAAQLYLELDDRSCAARCKCRAGLAYYLLGEYGMAESLLNEALAAHADLGNEFDEAMCRSTLGKVLRMNDDYPAAMAHLTAARRTFDSFGDSFHAAACIQTIGMVYRDQKDFASAEAEWETAYSMFVGLGHRVQIADTVRYLGDLRRREDDIKIAEHHQEAA